MQKCILTFVFLLFAGSSYPQDAARKAQIKKIGKAIAQQIDIYMSDEVIAKQANVYRKLYLALVKEGFTEEQAMMLVGLEGNFPTLKITKEN